MKIRVFILGLVVGIAIASTSTIFAADFVKAYLYPVKIVINDKEQSIPEGSTLLNHNNQAYVPLRFFAEKFGAKVGYQGAPSYEETKITLDFTNQGSISVGNNKLILDKDLIANARQGKLQGIDIPLGTSRQDLISKLGEPDKIGKQNSEYAIYSNTTFYIFSDEAVHVIDVKLDRSLAEVKELLGKPDYDGWNEAGDTNYIVGYEAESFSLYFIYSSPDAENGVLRFKNPKG